MEYPAPLVNAAGYLMVGAGAARNGLDWLVGNVPHLAQATPLGDAAAQAGNNALMLGLLGLATLIVNSYFADKKSRREADKRFAEINADAERKVAEAKEEADRRAAALEAKLDAANDMINRLMPRLEIAAKAIDTTTSAVVKVAENAGVSVAVAPKMNGGHGAMDLPKANPIN